MHRMSNEIVYKYLSPDRYEVLESGCIRFTQLNALNDPFEGLPNTIGFKEHVLQQLVPKFVDRYGHAMAPAMQYAASKVTDHYFSQVQDALSHSFALLSLSRTKDNLVMWSHYCASHTGFVVGFDAGSPFFAPGRNGRKYGLREVSYSNTRSEIPSTGLASLANSELEAVNDALFFRKSEHWSYERELRVLDNPYHADKTIKGPCGVDVFLYNFPSSCVREIICGANMDKELVERIARITAINYSDAILRQARVSDTSFQLVYDDNAC